MSTSIEWTDKTWNPVTGCAKVSAGCKNCYAEAIANRFFAKQYPKNPDGSERKFTDVRCHPDRLMQPLTWKGNPFCFVNSMSDLFHEDVPDQFITDVLGVMMLAHWVRFKVLTKRPERMRDYLLKGDHGIFDQFLRIRATGGIAPMAVHRAIYRKGKEGIPIGIWPLPNVAWGVSVENQPKADERIPFLLETPAAIRFISVEPMLEEIKVQHHLATFHIPGTIEQHIHWVICGGESGPGARPFNLTWAKSLLDQCRSAAIPFFMKQLGTNPYSVENRIASDTLPMDLDIPDGFYRKMADPKGGDPAEWPEKLRVREWPAAFEVKP